MAVSLISTVNYYRRIYLYGFNHISLRNPNKFGQKTLEANGTDSMTNTTLIELYYIYFKFQILT